MTMWIDRGDFEVGDVGFLIRTDAGRARGYSLSTLPARTNQSYQARLYGWCGTTNNVGLYAEGLARVVRVTKSGWRAQIEFIDAATREGTVALEELGYPDLAP